MIKSIDNLLKKAVIRAAATSPLATANTVAARQRSRAIYIVKVLNAPAQTQAQVRNAAALSKSKGQKSLAALLTMFAALPASKKVPFIMAFKRRAGITASIPLISANHRWNWKGPPPPPPVGFRP